MTADSDRHAWRSSGVEAVAPGVHRIPLPIPDSSLGAVNVYLVSSADGALLIDSGWAGPQTDRALGGSLAELGLHPRELTRIVVTHCHHDHYTEALALHARYGIPISLGRGEQPSIDAYALPLPHRQTPERLRRNGASELGDAYQTMSTRSAKTDRAPWGPPQHWLIDGERVALADHDLEIVDTPGHTRGHIVVRDDAAGLLFAGDHVLPHITPSIGYDAAMARYPLRDYLASLQLVRNRPDLLLLPAHGPVRASTHRRVDELLAHHADRLADVLARVASGDTTAFEIAQALRWTRRSLRFEELGDVVNKSLAVLEIEAHLDVLTLDGQLVEMPAAARDGARRETYLRIFCLPSAAAATR